MFSVGNISSKSPQFLASNFSLFRFFRSLMSCRSSRVIRFLPFNARFWNSVAFSLLNFYFFVMDRFRILMTSQRSPRFILVSKGESQANEGAWFTSIIHGLRLSSRNISKPNISKHIALSTSSGWQDLKLWASCGYTVINDLTIVSLILAITLSYSWP